MGYQVKDRKGSKEGGYAAGLACPLLDGRREKNNQVEQVAKNGFEQHIRFLNNVVIVKLWLVVNID